MATWRPYFKESNDLFSQKDPPERLKLHQFYILTRNERSATLTTDTFEQGFFFSFFFSWQLLNYSTYSFSSMNSTNVTASN